MEGITNASFTMADEIIRTIDEDRRQMRHYHLQVLQYNVDAIKPMVDYAIMIWTQIFNKLKKTDEEFYNELRDLKDKCIKISRSDVFRMESKQQYEIFDTLTELNEKIQEAFGIIGIDIKVRVK